MVEDVGMMYTVQLYCGMYKRAVKEYLPQLYEKTLLRFSDTEMGDYRVNIH